MLAKACLALLALAAPACGLNVKADESKEGLTPFNVKFDLALRHSGRKGDVQNASFKVRIHPEWAPGGAAQFKRLAEEGWYDGAAFFRVVDGFVAQFGMPAKPHPEPEKIRDDPVKRSNTRGTLVFATSGPNSRTAQLFINLKNNDALDGQGFAPFGEVLGQLSMGVVDSIYRGYGEKPDQGKIAEKGNRYLDAEFPMLTKINKLTISEH